jgi:hypothetical protein
MQIRPTEHVHHRRHDQFHLADPSWTDRQRYGGCTLSEVLSQHDGPIRHHYLVRRPDLDASTDNAVQQVALRFRVGNSGTSRTYRRVHCRRHDRSEFHAVTVCAPPGRRRNQALVEVRIMTTNAVSTTSTSY